MQQLHTIRTLLPNSPREEYNIIGQMFLHVLWIANNVRVRIVGVLISGLMLTMVAGGVLGGVWGGWKIAEIGAFWHRFDIGAASKQNVFGELRDHLSVGGIVHHTKLAALGKGDAEGARATLARIRALVAAYRSAGATDREERALQQLIRTVEGYEQAVNAMPRGGTPAERLNILLHVDDAPAVEAIRTLNEGLRAEYTDGAHQIDDSISHMTVSIVALLVANSALLLVLAVFFHWFTRWRIGQPLDALGHAMERLAQDDKMVEVPFREKRDEIGDMARAVQVFKENALRLDEMAEASRRAEQAAQATRQREMQVLADRFEAEIKGVVDAVSGAAGELQSLAQSMASMVDDAVERAARVAEASEQATGRAGAVAAATEQLAASIGEITRQVGVSSQIANQAVQEACRAQSVMGDLASASVKIGEITSIIEEIAGRIDLLALNATIEAARAGEAGKGFAVVASEVKTLSGQTAKATGDITDQISAIKHVSNEAVTAISQINGIIDRINVITIGVSAAVDEQACATSEITRTVDQVAVETRVVSDQIAEVTHSASQTGEAAQRVLEAARRLGRQADSLSGQVSSFVARVRTS